MSLERYCHPKRTVILNPATTVYDAARALENNHIGAVVVQDRGRVVGIATDRDLALRVVGFDVNPKTAPLRDVMTPDPATLPMDSDEEHAVELMRERHVRRIPIVDAKGAAVGIVTLDDLLLTGKIERWTAADIVGVQLAESARAKPAGVAYPVRSEAGHAWGARETRHTARAVQTLHTFAARMEARLKLGNPDRALIAVEVVAAGVSRRLTPREAQHFAAQLPSVLRERLLNQPAGPDVAITRATIETVMVQILGVDAATASRLVREVGAALTACVSPGEIEDVISQLPSDMKEIFRSGARPWFGSARTDQ